MISRSLLPLIKGRLHQGKVVVLLGARQVGKTTLVQQVVPETQTDALWLNGDEPDVRVLLEDATSSRLRNIIGAHRMVVIDEAQRINNIGITAKIIVDWILEVQLILTGSSTLNLADQIVEPLTGRKFTFNLFPLSFAEMVSHHGLLEERRQLEHRMVFGYYPEIVTHPSDAAARLKELASSYLYQDLLMLEEIKKPALLEKLLRALALQLGSEVSYNELGQTVGADRGTVEKYIDLLEKVFVIFRLPALSRNVRNEIKKARKIYFHDNGIRNAILGNLNDLVHRSDAGALWENFLISERMKTLRNAGQDYKAYFWRTTQQQEIDYIEERAQKLFAWEFKWNPRARVRFPKTFSDAYPESATATVSRDNLESFLVPEVY